MDTFVSDERKLKSAYTAMKYGLATSVGLGVGIYLVYGDKGIVAAVASAATGGFLYYIYDKKLKQSPQLAGVFAQRNGKTTQSPIQTMENRNGQFIQISNNIIGKDLHKNTLAEWGAHILLFG